MKLHRLDHDPQEGPADEADVLYVGVCSRCGARWQGANISHCPTCHLTFTTVTGFDAHRTGSYARDARRCRTEDEMRERGYEPNERGHYRKPGNDQWWETANEGEKQQ